MKINYKLDIGPDSSWLVNSPTAVSKRLPFYLNECGHYYAGTGYFTERQGLNDFLLMYTLSGNGFLKYRDQEYLLGPGQAVVIDCNNYHYYKTSINHWNFKWIHFNGTSAKDYYQILNEDSLSIVRVGDSPEFESLLDSLNQSSDLNDIPSNIIVANQLTKIISSLIISKFSRLNLKKYDQHHQEVLKVINYIQENYQQPVTLNDLTGVALMSRYYFLRVFKNHTGASPYEYLINYRINKAKELLKNTNLPVAEIGIAVGFVDYNNFIRKFKNAVGYTPLQYKKLTDIKDDSGKSFPKDSIPQ
ncbi:MAG: AraC family transcriptional regulator [Bacillota bacterium]